MNKLTNKDVYPLPHIDETLDCLHGSQYFSSRNLRSDYRQTSVDEREKNKPAFITPDGLFEFKVMSFGLCDAPSTFEPMMDFLLRVFHWSICLCLFIYLDDIVVLSTILQEHLERLDKVLSCLRTTGFQLNAEKCHFASR